MLMRIYRCLFLTLNCMMSPLDSNKSLVTAILSLSWSANMSVLLSDWQYSAYIPSVMVCHIPSNTGLSFTWQCGIISLWGNSKYSDTKKIAFFLKKFLSGNLGKKGAPSLATRPNVKMRPQQKIIGTV